MARDRKGQPRLPLGCARAVGDQQGAHVQHSRERREPGLVVVLRPEITKHGVGQMAFHQLRGPDFPIAKILRKHVRAGKVSVAAEQLRGVTSPSPRVKMVVPLMYRSVLNDGASPDTFTDEPAANCSIANTTIRMSIQVANSPSSESGP